jgi:hypothetical protein
MENTEEVQTKICRKYNTSLEKKTQRLIEKGRTKRYIVRSTG